MNLQVFSLATAQRYLKFLGFTYCDQKKTYYNDGHERKDNILYRQIFIKNYFSMELNQYLWVQIPSDVAIVLENNSQLLSSPDLYYSYISDDGSPMREYHIDVHPELFKDYIRVEPTNLLAFGGNLSVRRDTDCRIVVLPIFFFFKRLAWATGAIPTPPQKCRRDYHGVGFSIPTFWVW